MYDTWYDVFGVRMLSYFYYGNFVAMGFCLDCSVRTYHTGAYVHTYEALFTETTKTALQQCRLTSASRRRRRRRYEAFFLNFNLEVIFF